MSAANLQQVSATLPPVDWSVLLTFITSILGIAVAWAVRKQPSERTAEMNKVVLDAGLSAAHSVEILLGPLNDKVEAQARVIASQQDEIIALQERQRIGMMEREQARKDFEASIATLKSQHELEIDCLQEGLAQVKSEATRIQMEAEQRMAARDAEVARQKSIQDSHFAELRAGLAVLIAQLEQAGIKPRYKPKTGPLADTPEEGA